MLLVVLSMLVQIAGPAASPALVRSFEDDKIGAPPAGFVMATGREAAADKWSVTREGSGRVLVHMGNPAPEGFAVAILSHGQYQDVELSVRLKAAGTARSAGLVFKYQDPQNHYTVQLDLVRQQLSMYRVSGGNRIRIEREDDLELDPEAWHSLKILHTGGQIRVYLGGIRVFSERDRFPRTGGSVGLWSSGDTTAMFDDFRVADATGESGKGGGGQR